MIIKAITIPIAQNWIMWVRLLSQDSNLFNTWFTQFPTVAEANTDLSQARQALGTLRNECISRGCWHGELKPQLGNDRQGMIRWIETARSAAVTAGARMRRNSIAENATAHRQGQGEKRFEWKAFMGCEPCWSYLGLRHTTSVMGQPGHPPGVRRKPTIQRTLRNSEFAGDESGIASIPGG